MIFITSFYLIFASARRSVAKEESGKTSPPFSRAIILIDRSIIAIIGVRLRADLKFFLPFSLFSFLFLFNRFLFFSRFFFSGKDGRLNSPGEEGG